MSRVIPRLDIISTGQPHEAVVIRGGAEGLAALQNGIAAALTKAQTGSSPCLVIGPSFFDAAGEEFELIFSIEQAEQTGQGAEAQGVETNAEN